MKIKQQQNNVEKINQQLDDEDVVDDFWVDEASLVFDLTRFQKTKIFSLPEKPEPEQNRERKKVKNKSLCMSHLSCFSIHSFIHWNLVFSLFTNSNVDYRIFSSFILALWNPNISRRRSEFFSFCFLSICWCFSSLFLLLLLLFDSLFTHTNMMNLFFHRKTKKNLFNSMALLLLLMF